MNVRKRRWGCAHKSGDPFWHLEMLSQRRVAIKKKNKPGRGEERLTGIQKGKKVELSRCRGHVTDNVQ